MLPKAKAGWKYIQKSNSILAKEATPRNALLTVIAVSDLILEKFGLNIIFFYSAIVCIFIKGRSLRIMGEELVCL